MVDTSATAGDLSTALSDGSQRQPWVFHPCVRCGFCCRIAVCSLAYYYGQNKLLDMLDKDPNAVCPYLKGDRPGEYWCQILREKDELGQYVGVGGGCSSALFNDDRDEAKRLWSSKYMTLREMFNKHKWGDKNLGELTLTFRHRGAPNDERVVSGSDITEVGQTGVGFGVEAVEECEVTEDPDWIFYYRILKVEDADGNMLWEKRT
jgi:uncharacterized protein (UPF0248 family)